MLVRISFGIGSIWIYDLILKETHRHFWLVLLLYFKILYIGIFAWGVGVFIFIMHQLDDCTCFFSVRSTGCINIPLCTYELKSCSSSFCFSGESIDGLNSALEEFWHYACFFKGILKMLFVFFYLHTCRKRKKQVSLNPVSVFFFPFRRMFPAMRVKIAGLDPHQQYYIAMDIVPVDNKRYRYFPHTCRSVPINQAPSMSSVPETVM